VVQLFRNLFNLDKLHLRRDAESLGDYCVIAERALSPQEVDEAIAEHLLKGGKKPKRGRQMRIRFTSSLNCLSDTTV
jgi:hypothetical protein